MTKASPSPLNAEDIIRAFESAQVGHAVTDSDGRLKYCSQVFKDQTQLKEARSKKEDPWFLQDHAPSPLQKSRQSLWRTFIGRNQVWQGVVRWHLSENNIRFFEGTSIPLPNGDVILVINDRTERIEAKRVLRNMDKIQQEVLVDLPLSVMLFTKNSEIVLTNDYILKHIGKSAHDVINTKAQDSLGKGLSALSYDVVKKVVKTGESIDSGIVNIKKGPLAGQHWLVFGRPLHSRKYNVNGVLVISIDRTDSVKLNEERVRFAEAVHQSQKIEALNDFAGSLAHELSNLLHPVAAYARLLAKTPDDQKRAEYASKINKGTMAAGDILKRTLTMARTDKNEAKHCNIYDITHETITTAKDLAPASLSYDFHSSQTEVIGFAQEGELRQVLLNLLNNAAEAMAYRGRIKIKIETNQPEPASVKLRNPQQTRFIKISVIDQGPGFSSKIKSRLFDPFFTTKPGDRGTGLGLPVVKGLVTGWGGAVSVDTPDGGGAAFHVWIPENMPS